MRTAGARGQRSEARGQGTATAGEWRPLLIPAGVFVLWLAGEGVLVATGHPAPCAFRLITGIPCATCGSTRAMLRLLLHFDVPGALAFNPLVTCLMVLGPVLAAAHVALRAAGRRGLPPVFSRRPVVAAIACVALLLANWAYVLRAERTRGAEGKRNREGQSQKARGTAERMRFESGEYGQ